MLQRLVSRKEPTGLMPLVLGMILILQVTALVTLAMDGAHNGRTAGNEAMAVSAVWGFGGLGLALTGLRLPGPYLRDGARMVLAAALLYLVMGALLGNARWAVPAVRFLGYVAVLGSIWVSEALLTAREPQSDVNGLLGLTASAVGVLVCGFEVVRWLGPIFFLPLGHAVSPELIAWQDSTRAFTMASVWAVYASGVMVAGVWLRSPAARLLAAAILGVAIGYAGATALTNPAAPVWLRAATTGLLSAAALFGAYLAQRAGGERHSRERWAVPAMKAGALLLPALWGLAAFVG